MIPDAEKLVSRFLRDHDSVDALGARVVGKTPKQTEEPWVRVIQIAAPQLPGAPFDHLVPFLLQLDCYASDDNGQPEVNELQRTVRAALMEMPGVHSDGVVTSARITGSIRIPDTDFEPARERVTLTAQVHVHP